MTLSFFIRSAEAPVVWKHQPLVLSAGSGPWAAEVPSPEAEAGLPPGHRRPPGYRAQPPEWARAINCL